MMVPTLVYAMLYTFLLYDNFHSITLPLFVVVTIGYCGYVPFYDPIMIIEKTEGRMAEDNFWIRIER